jgi:hypothetical protein
MTKEKKVEQAGRVSSSASSDAVVLRCCHLEASRGSFTESGFLKQ